MKLDMYRKLQKCVDEVRDDMEIHLRHQKSLVQRSENSAVRWKRIKELAEDIEIALEDVTKETFDKKKVKAKVRELQASEEKQKKSMRRNGRRPSKRSSGTEVLLQNQYLMQLECFCVPNRKA